MAHRCCERTSIALLTVVHLSDPAVPCLRVDELDKNFECTIKNIGQSPCSSVGRSLASHRFACPSFKCDWSWTRRHVHPKNESFNYWRWNLWFRGFGETKGERLSRAVNPPMIALVSCDKTTVFVRCVGNRWTMPSTTNQSSSTWVVWPVCRVDHNMSCR